MNIFILDSNHEKCAQYHCDKHVPKMILETAQIMSTVMHKKNPHASKNIIDIYMNFKVPDQGLTPFAQAMPEKYKVTGNAIKAYRQFYKGEKSHFARWTKRATPIWFK